MKSLLCLGLRYSNLQIVSSRQDRVWQTCPACLKLLCKRPVMLNPHFICCLQATALGSPPTAPSPPPPDTAGVCIASAMTAATLTVATSSQACSVARAVVRAVLRQFSYQPLRSAVGLH